MRIMTFTVFVILTMDVTSYKLIRESLYDSPPKKRALFLISSFTEQKPCYKPVYRVLVLRLLLNKSSKNVNAPKQGVVISPPMCVNLSENKFSGGTHERKKNNHMGRADPCLPE